MNFKRILSTILIAAISITCVSAQKRNTSSAHSKNHANLIASRNNSKSQIKLIEKNSFIDLLDDIEPEPDIYTEGMNSRLVNPFNPANVPDKAIIDVRNYYMPTKTNRVNSNYGYRAKFGRMHKGVDLHIRMNDTIYAAFSGKVRLTNYEAKGYGNYIIIRHGNNLETVYGHLNRSLVKKGQTVRAGQPIALGGNTGRSTGPHLHFETRYMGYAINPNAIFDFANRTTHTDTYAFSKQTYKNARNYAPKTDVASSQAATAYQHGAQNNSNTYTVKQGDSVSTIARKYGIARTRLLQLNNLKAGDILKPGQVIKVK